MLAVHGTTGAAVPATAALTNLGYSGEHFDAKTQQQYLRARWYNPANGQFNRLDPFAGNMQDPQSLHKYAYVHGDPLYYVDPTGLFSMASSLAGSTIGAQLNSMTFEFGQTVLQGLGADTTVLNPLLFAATWVWDHLPESVRDSITGVLNALHDFIDRMGYRKAAGVTLATASFVAWPRKPRSILGTEIYRHQNQILKNTFSVSGKGLANYVRKRAADIASRFHDAAHGGLISPREALSIARWETLADDIVKESTHPGVDFVSALLGKVSLKGPAVRADGTAFPLSDINNLVARAIDDASGMHNQIADAVVLDLMGASANAIQQAKGQCSATTTSPL